MIRWRQRTSSSSTGSKPADSGDEPKEEDPHVKEQKEAAEEATKAVNPMKIAVDKVSKDLARVALIKEMGHFQDAAMVE